ncbi:hypothetical protein CC78DRAFT_173373 [Lojkania enalia]|uniref:Uncharacterized protein n=1 Tax=Lojkania enalia TaxID=147567 RepID=A0A9P4KG04_9PLEO|nr:hypothetical protein CC78DRAFT_173373 [Didymosphaeria enalia]
MTCSGDMARVSLLRVMARRCSGHPSATIYHLMGFLGIAIIVYLFCRACWRMQRQTRVDAEGPFRMTWTARTAGGLPSLYMCLPSPKRETRGILMLLLRDDR